MSNAVNVSSSRLPFVLLGPVVTEKSTAQSAGSKCVFKVCVDATKPQIKKAAEAFFSVKVLAVNTLNRAGKKKMFRGRPGRRPAFKYALVTLAEGQSIDFGRLS